MKRSDPERMKRVRRSPERPKKRANSGNPSNKKAGSKNYIKTGNVGTFLSNDFPDERLIGTLPKAEETAYSNLVFISKFLADYRAISTLHSTTKSPTNVSSSAPRGTAYYLPTIRDFAQTQRDRQSAGLRTNTNSKTSQGMTQVVESHSRALEAAMVEAETADVKFPTKATLCQWHGILCHNGQESFFRETLARAGSTMFCPPKHLDREFNLFHNAMLTLYSKWESKIIQATNIHNEDAQITSTYYSVALAAIILYGLTDIHMYSDGNGRLSRICTNWMLKRILGLPFTITLAANPQQRREYIDALKQGLHSILPQQQSSKQQLPQSKGIFTPLIHLLLDRMTHAIQECQRKLSEKSQVAIAEDEARIARRVRERAAEGQCIICLDEKPNIATLCCGQAVHLNCVAEWLASASNCVGCRAPLPPMRFQRPQALQEQAETENDDDDDDVDDEDDGEFDPQNIRGNLLQIRDTLQGIINRQNDRDESGALPMCRCGGDAVSSHCANGLCRGCCVRLPFLCAYHDPPVEDEETTTTVRQGSGVCGFTGCSNLLASACPNSMCGNCCVQYGVDYDCARHGGEEEGEEEEQDDDDEDEDTTTILVLQHADITTIQYDFSGEDTTSSAGENPSSHQHHQGPSYCRYCTNRAAVDCDNGMCGGCCVLVGLEECPRHNNR
jgi:Fic family protein